MDAVTYVEAAEIKMSGKVSGKPSGKILQHIRVNPRIQTSRGYWKLVND